MSKEKIEFEYIINCSPKVLFNRLSTASGLAEWFADDVSVNGKKFTFFWNDVENVAELTFIKENLIVHFEWVEDKTYFEFKITRDELTGDVSLIVIDFTEPDEKDDIRSLWESLIIKLRHVVGS